jgi:mono/diheme cytochrome c family protein
MTPVRFLTILCFALLFGAFAAGSKSLAWVTLDPTTNTYRLSNGDGFTNTANLEPGQFVEISGSAVRGLEQWRSPNDIEKRYNTSAGRVNFSHERHFGALGGKNCIACHADEKGLAKNEPIQSKAPSADLEPHAVTSTGRFCSGCHNANTKAADAAGGQPKLNVTIFSSFGKTDNASCNMCHVPASHGADFTANHPDLVGATGVNSCNTCHRGGKEISLQALGQAKTFVHAQQKLAHNPQDESAFAARLPNQFCSYCHANQSNFFNLK